MDLELSGKNVVITGGSKGIGLACAQAFLAERARVGITSRAMENITRAQSALGQIFDHKVFGYAADLVSPDATAKMIEAMERELGPIDILVNSAGAARRTPPADLTPLAWKAAMDAKFFTYIHPTDLLVKRMAARGHGVIVNVIGNGGKLASPAHIAGGAANAALMLATAGLGAAYAAQGVRVVGVNPGLTRTERVAEGLKAESKLLGTTEEDALRQAIAKIPLGRLAEADEIAHVVVFLASSKASYLTGVTISMDGAQAPTVV
jgi:NAD(P)-dependent dehydrogenase (short-subunit alcohol dehydrogenase family)